MEELKNFELNNRVLEDFDKIMSYHLDKVENLIIKEVFTNSKLFNIISLCTKLKSLTIEGDLRVDVNKIIFNICKPELLETLILNSVKLPTTKSFTKFTNLTTISLTNITFSDVNGFFNKITNKDKIIAINLSNVDLGRKSISICGMFPNLKYLNLDGLRNCKFDNFIFLAESNKIERLDFFGNEISFDALKDLSRKKYIKNIDVKLKTSKKSLIDNRFEINDENEISLTINSFDFEKATSYLPLSKIKNLFLVIEDKFNIEEYIRKLKRVKGKVSISIKNVSYLESDTAKDLQDKLELENIGILDYEKSKIKMYSINDYIEIREKFDEIVGNLSKHSNDIELFEELYNYIKVNIRFDNENESNIKTFYLENYSGQNLYAIILDDILKFLKINSHIISGISYNEPNCMWNQVKLAGDWYNIDIASDIKFKLNKKIWQSGSKGVLQDDEEFSKTHIEKFGNPEACETKISQKKIEIKNNNKKVSPFNKFVNKLKNVFKFNKNTALPEPGNTTKDKED